MKLHLNLTLRRALLAAMAMVALHTADAGMAPTNGHMYVTGEVSPTTEEWTEAWGSTTGVLSVGTSVGAGTLTLSSGDYTTPDSIFLGGKGYESNGSTASDGTLNIQEGATLTANGSTNVGNSQIGGTGYLTLNGGTLNAGNALYVGVNAGSGIVNVTDGGSITVASDSTGAVFAMSHRIIPNLEDTVTLTGSTITVGAAGGVVDYTTIGHSAGIATLYLEDGSTANFHDQTIVGERGGSNGTIHVHSSTLNMGTTTVLGSETNAYGTICLEDGTAQGADTLVLGSKGNGFFEMSGASSLSAKSIELGDAANSYGYLGNQGTGTITTDLLTIGQAGEGEVTIADGSSLSATDIKLGYASTGKGTLSIRTGATIGKITNLVVGYEGKGTLVTESNITADYTTINQAASSVTVKNKAELRTGYLSILGGTLNIATVDENGNNTEGSVYVSGATSTDAGSTINIAVGGELTTQGGSSEINGATIETVIGGKVNIDGSRSNDGEFSDGSWNANGSTTMLGTLTNDGVLNVGGTMAALQGITGEGLVNVTSGTSSLTLGGTSEINSIDNDGKLTVNGSVETRLYGTGSTEVSENGILTLVDNTLSDNDKQVNSHKITNNGILNIKCKDTTYLDSIINNAQLNIYTDLANNIGGTGTATVKKDATWTLGSSAGYITQTQINVEEGAKLDINGVSFTDSEANPTGIPSIDNDGILSFDNVDLGIGYQNKGIVITGSGKTVVEKGAHVTIVGDSSQSVITNSGSLQIAGGKTEVPTIANNGDLVVMGDLTTTITGTGTTAVNSATLTLVGDNTQNAIMPWSGSKHVNLYGTLTLGGDLVVATTIFINSGTASGTAITAGSAKAVVSVDIDTTNAVGLLGKDVTFVTIKETVEDEVTSTNQGISSVNISGLTDDELKKGYKVLAEATENSGEQRLSFTATGDSTNGYTSIVFNKLSEVLQEAKDEVVAVVPPTGDTTTEEEITVTLKYEKQTLAATEDTLSDIPDEYEALETAIGTASNQTLQTVAIESSESTTGGSANIVDMVIGSGLTTSSGLTVQTVVVNQVTTTGTKEEEKTAGTTGMVLILDGQNKIEGKEGQKANNHLGFSDEVNGQTLTTTDTDPQKAQKKAQTIDLIQVNEGTSVTLSNLNMHSTHNMHVGAGTTIVFDNVSVKVGGSEDNSLKYDEVVVETTDGTKTVLVENKNSAHLDIHSEFEPGSIINISNGSEVEFHHVTGKNDKGEKVYAHDDVLFNNATIVMDNLHDDDTGEKKTTTLGSLAEDAQVLRLVNSKLSGSGLVQNFVMTNGVLKVGNSPSELSVAKGQVKDSEVRFTLVTDSAEWDKYTGTPDGTLTPTYGTGAISQVKLDGALTLNNAIIGFTYEEKSPAGTTKDYTTQTNDEGKAAMAGKHLFAEGDSLTLFTGDIAKLSGTFSVDYESLPTLADENLLTWDWSTLLTNGKITVVLNERLEEPWRIANTLVSAGETVLNFGRLAEAQASLREAGTTRTWGSAIAMFDSIDSGSTTNGYDYSNWGAAVGIDHAFTKNTVVGVAFGCTWGENKPENGTDFYDAGSIDQDARMIGIYGVHKFHTKGLLNDVKLSAFAAYGMFENDSTRNNLKSGNTAKAEWDSDAWVLSASLSRDITTDSGVVFTPYVGVEYTTAGMDDFTEKGRVTTADYSADEDYSNLSVKVGVSVSKTYGSITPYANVAFISDVDRSAAKVTATGRETITGKSALPGRNGFEIGVGATWQLTENLDVNAGYSAEIRDKATEHNARLGVGYTF